MVAVLKGRAEEHVLSRIKQLLCAMWITFAITGPVRAAFEIVDGGAYAMSMGGALSAEIGSAETIWFNPAASAKLNVPHATSTYGTLYSGLEDSPVVHTGAIAWPVKSVTLQAGYHTLRLDPWSEMSGLVGVAVVLHPRVSFGGAVRVNAWNSGRYGNQSWLGSLGLLYEVGWIAPSTYMRLSLVSANLTGWYSAGDTGRATGQPGRLYTAGAQLIVRGKKVSLDVEHDMDLWDLRAGYELDARWGLHFRTGVGIHVDDTVDRTWHVGMGYEWTDYHFDYAFTRSADIASFGATHRLGIGRFF